MWLFPISQRFFPPLNTSLIPPSFLHLFSVTFTDFNGKSKLRCLLFRLFLLTTFPRVPCLHSPTRVMISSASFFLNLPHTSNVTAIFSPFPHLEASTHHILHFLWLPNKTSCFTANYRITCSFIFIKTNSVNTSNIHRNPHKDHKLFPQSSAVTLPVLWVYSSVCLSSRRRCRTAFFGS